MFSDSLIPLNTDPIAPKLEDVYENIFDSGNNIQFRPSNQDSDDESEGSCVKTLCLSSHKQQPYKGDNSNGEYNNVPFAVDKRKRKLDEL